MLKAEATHIEILSCRGAYIIGMCISLKEFIVIHLTPHLRVKQQALDFAIDNTGYVFHLDFLKNKIYNALVLHNCHSFSSQNPPIRFNSEHNSLNCKVLHIFSIIGSVYSLFLFSFSLELLASVRRYVCLCIHAHTCVCVCEEGWIHFLLSYSEVWL